MSTQLWCSPRCIAVLRTVLHIPAQPLGDSGGAFHRVGSWLQSHWPDQGDLGQPNALVEVVGFDDTDQ